MILDGYLKKQKGQIGFVYLQNLNTQKRNGIALVGVSYI